MNQKEMVEKYINEFGSIAPLEAIRDLGITKLATVVSDMKKEGYEFLKRHFVTSAVPGAMDPFCRLTQFSARFPGRLMYYHYTIVITTSQYKKENER